MSRQRDHAINPARLVLVAICAAAMAVSALNCHSGGGSVAAGNEVGLERRLLESKALALDPNLGADDVRLLSDQELDLSPVSLKATPAAFPRRRSPEFKPKLADASWPGFKYRYWRSPRELHDLPTDPSLAAPLVEVDTTDPLYPIARVSKAVGASGHEALYYFEFDTTPTFASPNAWRYPSLKAIGIVDRPEHPLTDLTGRSGLPLSAFAATQRNIDGRAREARFPFRVTAMRLPNDWAALTYKELELQALALGRGLTPAATIREVYLYTRHSYVWGSDSITRSPLDVFTAGVAECSAVNNLVGAMLEMNGLRYRIVTGFNPRYRVAVPEGGHSAIEVFDSQTGRWSYLDSYLDAFFPGVSAHDLATGSDPASEIPAVTTLVRTHQQFGPSITFGQLFKVRSYGDNLTRLPMVSGLRLANGLGESAYGLSWPLNKARPRPVRDLFPAAQTIYVRARWVFAGSRTVLPAEGGEPLLGPTERPVASPWGTASFTVHPRRLVSQSSGASPDTLSPPPARSIR